MLSFTKTTFALATLASLIAGVLSASVPISQPVKSTIWNAETTVSIQWRPPADLASKNVAISLVYGDPAALTQVGPIGTVDVKAGSFSWKIPNTLPTMRTYALTIETDPVTYSDQFTIMAAAGINTSIPTLPPAAPAAGGAPPSGGTTGAGTAANSTAGAAKPKSQASSLNFQVLPLLGALLIGVSISKLDHSL